MNTFSFFLSGSISFYLDKEVSADCRETKKRRVFIQTLEPNIKGPLVE